MDASGLELKLRRLVVENRFVGVSSRASGIARFAVLHSARE